MLIVDAHLVNELPWTEDQTTNRLPSTSGKYCEVPDIAPSSPINSVNKTTINKAETNGMMHILNLTIVFSQNLSGSSVSSDRVISFAIESYLLATAVIQYPRERPMKKIAADSIKLSDKAVAYRMQHNNTIVMM